MTGQPKTKYAPEVWQQKANEDLAVAEELRDLGTGHFGIICFHCQQAAEKYLKHYSPTTALRFRGLMTLNFSVISYRTAT